MENLMSRYRNVSILVAILFVQVLGLAVQVKRRSGADESTRIIRLWTVSAVTPLEKALVWCQNGVGGLWSNYIYLRGVRQENRDLKFEIERLRLEQVRLSEDAAQARRLQALLGFKEQYIAKTVAAQVIGSSGSEQSRSIYIDKGTSAGVEKDMAVITADGLVGKVLRAYGSSAQVLLINDQSSGVGVILDKSRLQGVIKGTAGGEVILEKVMTGEQVAPGDLIVTSGGDQIFPKGIMVGTAMKVSPGADLFLNIRVKPSASLSRLEEVLIITKKEDRAPNLADTTSVRAVDILTQRLPSVPDKPAADPSPAATETPAKPAAQKTVPSARKALPETAKPAATSAPAQPAASETGTAEEKPH
jgi:rod shape-determining protein MreC